MDFWNPAMSDSVNITRLAITTCTESQEDGSNHVSLHVYNVPKVVDTDKLRELMYDALIDRLSPHIISSETISVN